MTAKPLPKKLYKQEAEISPVTCWPWLEVAGTYTLNADGEECRFGETYGFFQKGYGVVYWDFDALQTLARLFYRTRGTHQEYDAQYARYLIQADAIEQLYHKTFDPEAFRDEPTARKQFNALWNAYRAFWDESLFIDAFDTGVDQEEIKKIADQHGLSKDEVQTLSTPTEMTFADERKCAFLEHLNTRKITPQTINDLLKSDTITAYRRQFDYWQANYARLKPITDQEIIDEATLYVNNPNQLQADLAALHNYTAEKKQRIAAIVKQHTLPENPLWFFAALTAWREHRKKINLMGFHVIEAYLKTVEAETGIPNRELRCLTFDEIDLVLNGSLHTTDLKRRHEQGMVVQMTAEGYKLFDSAEAQSLKAELDRAFTGATPQDILYGRTASQGYATGVARVVLAEADFPQFNRRMTTLKVSLDAQHPIPETMEAFAHAYALMVIYGLTASFWPDEIPEPQRAAFLTTSETIRRASDKALADCNAYLETKIAAGEITPFTRQEDLALGRKEQPGIRNGFIMAYGRTYTKAIS